MSLITLRAKSYSSQTEEFSGRSSPPGYLPNGAPTMILWRNNQVDELHIIMLLCNYCA